MEDGSSSHVLHRCDNPKCVNPQHLFLGTLQDNKADSVAKGRHKFNVYPGSLNRNAKLNESLVRAIRQEYASGVSPVWLWPKS